MCKFRDGLDPPSFIQVADSSVDDTVDTSRILEATHRSGAPSYLPGMPGYFPTLAGLVLSEIGPALLKESGLQPI